MSTAYPPTEYFNGIYYNQQFYQTNFKDITLAYINANFLKSVGVALSTATITTFTGAVSISGLLTISGGISLSGGLTVDTLTVNSTSSFIGQSTFTLVPILPSGYQFLTTGIQTISGSKTFTSTLNTNGISDLVSITSPIITASTVCNAPYFNATNPTGTSFLYGTSIGGILACNIITNTSSSLPYILNCLSVPIPTTTSTVSGMGIGWNSVNGGGTGECDLINYGQFGAGGGFNFSTITNASVNRNLGLLSIFANGGFTINPACGQLRIQDINSGISNLTVVQNGSTTYFNSNGITTTMAFPVSNSLGALINVLLLGDNFVSTYAPFTPQSTTAFNAFHPTTTLGNNISTNTTQYATVGYVNSNSGASILPSNNTFTGLNTFTQSIQMTIKTDPSTTSIGTGAGGNLSTLATGSANTFYGTSAGIVSTLCNNETVIGANSGVMTAGNQSYNTVIGAGSRYLGNNNTVVGSSAGNFSTTVVYNNSTCIGTGTLMTASNQITIGRATETVLINGTLTTTGTTNINNTIMTGTAVVNNDLQINGNTIRPLTISTASVPITYNGYIPPYIIFIPAPSMAFTLPAPSAANVGQEFVIRKYSAGGGQTVIFSCVGNLAVWVPTNSGPNGNTTLAVTTVWQFRFVSTGTLFLQIS